MKSSSGTWCCSCDIHIASKSNFVLTICSIRNHPSIEPFPIDMNCVVCDKEDSAGSCGSCGLVKYCSKDCQIKDRPSHKYFCSKLVRVENIEGAGAGVFARQAFNVGDELLRESPVYCSENGRLRALNLDDEQFACAVREYRGLIVSM